MEGPARKFFVHGSLEDIARDRLEARNVDHLRLTDRELFENALSSSDFPVIIQRIANRRLLPMYEAEPRNWADFVTTNPTGAQNFKPIEGDILDNNFRYYEMSEGANDVPRSEFVEAKISYRVKRYALELNITYETMIDDDLNAINRNLSALPGTATEHYNRHILSLIHI